MRGEEASAAKAARRSRGGVADGVTVDDELDAAVALAAFVVSLVATGCVLRSRGR